LQDGPDVTVYVDPLRLEQMVGNVLSNALRYAPDGPIDVEVSLVEQQDVVISVRDQGPGIEPADLARVWDRFFRSSHAELTSQGTGLGLNLVRSLAELHGGRAEMDSTPGIGTTVRIILPRGDETVIPYRPHDERRLKRA
jgi:signal transduction histidine kinase